MASDEERAEYLDLVEHKRGRDAANSLRRAAWALMTKDHNDAEPE